MNTDDRNIAKGGPGSGNFGHAGRPGQVGGSGGGGGGTERETKINGILKETENDGRERAFLVFPDGSTSEVSVGEANLSPDWKTRGADVVEGVDTPKVDGLLKEGARLELVHTHPLRPSDASIGGYSGLSTGDLATLHQYPGRSTVTAVDLDGNSYSVTRTKDDPDSLHQLWVRQRDIAYEVHKDIIDRMLNDEITRDQANIEIRREPLKIMAALESEGLVTYSERMRGSSDKSKAEAPRAVRDWAASKFADPAKAKAFCDWFGDSKVVDDKGEPLVVYHGTASEVGFTEFKGEEIWFTSDPEIASDYARQRNDSGPEMMIPVYLSVRNPATFEQFLSGSTKALIGQGYDGATNKSGDGHINVVVFSSTQIKSATGNRGTFDPKDPDVTKGGPGSGNFGHAGIPGHVGGSSSGGGDSLRISAETRSAAASYKIIENRLDYNDIGKDWPGFARSIAGEAVEEFAESAPVTKAFKARTPDGKPAAVMTYVDRGIEYEVEYLASGAKGAGTRMMHEICKLAAKNDKGVYLLSASTPQAHAFYTKMGMTKQRDNHHFRFTPEQAKAFAAIPLEPVKQHTSVSLSELEQLEPTDGVFVLKELSTKEISGRTRARKNGVRGGEKSASRLLKHVHNSKEWTSKIIDAALPVLAVGMAKAAVGQMLSLGVDVRRKRLRKKGGPGSGNFGHEGRPGQVGGSGGGGDNEDKSRDTKDPVSSMSYGGLPDGGGYDAYKEYEIGAQRMAESAHCILGSLGKIANHAERAGGFTEEVWHYERSHVLEELGIIERCVNEYSKDIYHQRQFQNPDEYNRGCVEDVQRVSPKLRDRATRMADQFELHARKYPDKFSELARQSYDVVIRLADAMERSVEGQTDRPKFNAYRDPVLRASVAKLRSAVDRVYPPKDPNITKSINTIYTKTSRASDWLRENPDDLQGLADILLSSGAEGISIFTEMPEEMKATVLEVLRDTFDQEYWENISETTEGAAERILEGGIQEGASVVEMAEEIADFLGGDDYANVRALNIARTESGNALNGARTATMQQLQDDLPELPMKRVWLSVLGSTTRDTHAELDGVPENEDGMFDVGGEMAPWPRHFSLSAGERCNCQCTITLEMGMDDDEARGLIQNYYDRQEEREEDLEKAGYVSLGKKGGPGSGNFGHAGIPGHLGGSAPGDGESDRFSKHSFGDGPPVEARRHKNPDGSVGGWVAKTATVSDKATVSENAKVYGNAKVLDNATVSGNATVSDKAVVSGEAKVLNDATVSGNATVTDKAVVFGKATVTENAKVSGTVEVYSSAKVYGNAEVSGKARVYSNAKVHGSAKVESYVSGNAEVFGNAKVFGKATVTENAKVYGEAKVHGNAEVSGNAKVLGMAEVMADTKVSGNAEVSGDARVFGTAEVAGVLSTGRHSGGTIIERPGDNQKPKFDPKTLSHIKLGRLPDKLVPFGGGELYEKTKALAKKIKSQRSLEICEDMGLSVNKRDLGKVSTKVWRDWKSSSTSDVGLALQLVASEEFGGAVRIESKEAAERGLLAIAKLVSSDDKEVGRKVMQAHVRATWEATQFVLSQAGVDSISLYRGIIMDESEVNDKGNPKKVGANTKLPGLNLLKNGCASTTVLPKVANEWEGVGGRRIDSEHCRVVMRMDVPRESILSIPVFGENIAGEEEFVVMGTKWNGWDIWKDKAPTADEVKIKSMIYNKSYGNVPAGVIDLMDVDLGQPHWLSKNPGHDHDQFVKGGPGSGNFGHAGIPGQVGGSAPGEGSSSSSGSRGWRGFKLGSTKDKYSDAKVEMNSYDPINEDVVRDALSDIFSEAKGPLSGKSPEVKLAALLGMPDDATLTIMSVGAYEPKYTDDLPLDAYGVRVQVEHADLTRAHYFIGLDNNDKRFMRTEIIEVDKPGTGFGAKLVERQVEAAVDLGMDYLSLHAAGSIASRMNGYYTWPRVGYDQPLKSIKKGLDNPQMFASARAEFPKAKTVLDIFAKPGGPEWWKSNGADLLDCHFELKPGSKSMQVLQRYVKHKEQMQKEGKKSVELTPTELEDEALRRAWEDIQREGWA